MISKFLSYFIVLMFYFRITLVTFTKDNLLILLLVGISVIFQIYILSLKSHGKLDTVIYALTNTLVLSAIYYLAKYNFNTISLVLTNVIILLLYFFRPKLKKYEAQIILVGLTISTLKTSILNLYISDKIEIELMIVFLNILLYFGINRKGGWKHVRKRASRSSTEA